MMWLLLLGSLAQIVVLPTSTVEFEWTTDPEYTLQRFEYSLDDFATTWAVLPATLKTGTTYTAPVPTVAPGATRQLRVRACQAYKAEPVGETVCGDMSTAVAVIADATQPGTVWTYAEDFDALTEGQPLHGQGGWVGWNVSGETDYTIRPYQGSRVAAVTIKTHATITRTLPLPLTKGDVRIVMGKSTSVGLTSSGFALRDSNGSPRIFARMGGDGHIAIYDHATAAYVNILSNYVAGTLYDVDVQFDQALQPNKYRARAKPKGVSLDGPWSAWVTVNGGTYERISTIVFDTDWNGGAVDTLGYFDAIGPMPVVTTEPPPVCTDVPSLFITRWEHTTGKPGSKMRVNFQPSSISPITEIEAKVNGQVVARVTGDDLRGTAGMWFTTPELGSHKLTVWAKNAVGCTREVFSPVDLVVK